MHKNNRDCPVCEAPNLVKSSRCHLCGAPRRLTGPEIESRRTQWESLKGDRPGEAQGLGLASKLALLLLADIGVSFVFIALATSGGGNPIGAGMVAGFLLIPAPFLALAWIVVVAYSYKRR